MLLNDAKAAVCYGKLPNCK